MTLSTVDQTSCGDGLGLDRTSTDRSLSSQERCRIVAAIDHDTRQPQRAAEMALRRMELVVSELDSPKASPMHEALLGELRADLSTLKSALNQIVRAQRELLDALVLDFGEVRTTHTAIFAQDVILRALRSNVSIARQTLMRAVPSRLTFVSDERLLERILNNLVVNAIAHSGATRIVVGARPRAGDIVFEVRDNGSGIRPQASRLLSQSTPGQAKAGLGLYNVCRFAERLGGTVRFKSHPGKGSLVQVRLPGPVDHIQRVQLSPSAMTGGRGKFVAILDAPTRERREMEIFFEHSGATVYADQDPIRWLGVVTDLGRAPNLVLFGVGSRPNESLVQLDILLRKWKDEKTVVAVLVDSERFDFGNTKSTVVRVIKRPMSGEQLEALSSEVNERIDLDQDDSRQRRTKRIAEER